MCPNPQFPVNIVNIYLNIISIDRSLEQLSRNPSFVDNLGRSSEITSIEKGLGIVSLPHFVHDFSKGSKTYNI